MEWPDKDWKNPSKRPLPKGSHTISEQVRGHSDLLARRSERILTHSLNDIISATKVAGRTELISNEDLNSPVLLDVGHNPQAARYLVEYLKGQKYNRLYAVTGMLKDKDIAKTFQPLFELVESWYLGGLSVSSKNPQ